MRGLTIATTPLNQRTPVYLNPTHVKLEDGESLRVRGDHAEIAEKLTLPS
jgi:hypothetical protein